MQLGRRARGGRRFAYRTARARIRDEALSLFGDRGPEAVTVRDIAAAAGVSPALVIRHYGSKDGLREAVDDHVTRVFKAMLDQAASPAGTAPLAQAAVPMLAELVAGALPADSPIPAYLSRMLLVEGGAGAALFRRLFTIDRDALADLTETGSAVAGADPDVRAAFLLVNDLAVLMLRRQLGDVLGVDPLSAAGMRRWGTEVTSILRDGLGGPLPAGPDGPAPATLPSS